MKVEVEDILNIRKGSSRVFLVDTPMLCNSARSLVYYVNKCRKPQHIEKYTASIDYDKCAVVIKAI